MRINIKIKKSFTISFALIIIFTIILVLAVGTGIVYLWVNKPTQARQKLAGSAKQSQEVFWKYQNADYAAARKALLDNISRLDGLNAESSHQNAYAVDAMISCVRLAKLEEKNGGTKQAEYMKEASARCGKLGWASHRCSEESLRQVTDQMDNAGSQEAGR